MSEYIIKYPLDLTGESPENRIEGEPHVLEPGLNRSMVPRYGAFYTDGLVLRDADTTEILVPNDQYIPIMYHAEASERAGLEVCAGIVVTDGTVSDNVVVDYQVVGDVYQNLTQVILDLIENLNLDEREVIWGDLLGRPDAFPPAHHLHDLGDIFGFEYLVQAVTDLRDAVLYGDVASHDELKAMIEDRRQQLQAAIDQLRFEYEEHRDRVDNPHSVTKAQTGLGSVENHPLSSKVEAEEGTSHIRYMTPLRVAQAIQVFAIDPLDAHKADYTNPHRVTKAQVGLGDVENMSLSTQVEAEEGSVLTSYMTPLRVSQAISEQALIPLTEHTDRIDNPHSVTKAQVGLGKVSNYPDSSKGEAELGEAQNRFMTPLRVAQAVAAQVGDAYYAHAANTDNPHSVTKAQTGLGNVPNWTPSTTGEARDGTKSDAFMSPKRTHEFLLSHIRKADGTATEDTVGAVGWYGSSRTAGGFYAGTADPQNINRLNFDGRLYATGFYGDGRYLTGMVKSQVGLTNVDDFPTSNKSEAELGTRNDRFMTPLRVAQAIAEQAGDLLQGHIDDKTNPHNVTKSQVGLGSVSNYSNASKSEAELGTSNSRFMTPKRVAEAISSQAGALLSTHINDKTNPHRVTKAQTGLGSVSNYSISSEAEAIAGNSNTRYMTPLRVSQAITSQAGSLLQVHVNDKSNPHDVTKAQVGLGSVDNVSSSVDATPNTLTKRSSSGDISARLFRSEYDSTNVNVGYIMTQVDTNSNNYLRPSTPGQVKSSLSLVRDDVGLGNVQNYAIASKAEAIAGNNNGRYMTPLRVAQAITASAGADLTTHIDDKTNPHNVTKTQVGLSEIPNAVTSSRSTDSDGHLLTAKGMVNHVNSDDHAGQYLRLNGQDTGFMLGKDAGNKSTIDFDAGSSDPGFIEHWESDDQSHMRFSVSDNNTGEDHFDFGSMNNSVWTSALKIYSDGRLSGDASGLSNIVKANVDEELSFKISGNKLYCYINGYWIQIYPAIWS